MPTGEMLDIGIKVGAAAIPLLAGFSLWIIRLYVRLQHRQRDCADLQERLDEDERLHESAWNALAEKYERLRATDQEVRERFYRLRAAYLATRAKLENGPTVQLVEQLQRAHQSELFARDTKLRRVIEQAKKLESEAGSIREREQANAQELAASRDLIADLTRQMEQATNANETARANLEEAESRLGEFTKFDGRLWLRPPANAIPPFRPLADRKTIIISVLNLKGGVGKTTIAANLAATLARADGRALLIDLDYQRSLSMLLVGESDRKVLHKAGHSVQHFLNGATHEFADLKEKLKDFGPDLPNCSLLTNSHIRSEDDAPDSLEETENRLMAEWLFDRRRPDVRFFLRQALHDPKADGAYKYVLLDCPPRLTTACVNALAASDFVLIPTVPDSVSTHAVENLLYTLRQFRTELLPDLNVVGIVPNMVKFYRDDLVAAHESAMRQLRDGLTGVWMPPPPIFKSAIKHDSAFGISAAEIDAFGKLRLAIADEEIRDAFRALAKEIEKEIQHHASRRSPAVPAKPAARARSGR
jgi:cellulose biosynthesis protein BcsQ